MKREGIETEAKECGREVDRHMKQVEGRNRRRKDSAEGIRVAKDSPE
jgi:hypothetical protein